MKNLAKKNLAMRNLDMRLILPFNASPDVGTNRRFSAVWVALVTLVGALTLTACSGYRSINSTTDLAPGEGVDVGNIYIARVEQRAPEQRKGERRIAQKMSQELRRRFTGHENAPYHVRILLSNEKRSLSSRRDATVSRWMYFLQGKATVTHQGEQVAEITSRTDAPYFVERSPVATQANLTQAQQSAARVLTHDMHRQLNILLHDESQNDPKNGAKVDESQGTKQGQKEAAVPDKR